MSIPRGILSGTEFANVFMAQPEITPVPNTNPQRYTLPRETIIEILPYVAPPGTWNPWSTPPGTYTVVDYDTHQIIQQGLFGGEPTVIQGTPRFNLRDQAGANQQLLVGVNNVQIKKLNGRTVGWQTIRTLTAIRPGALDALERSVIRTNAPPNPETGFPGGPGYLEAVQELATINDALNKGGKKSRKSRKARKAKKSKKRKTR